MSSRSFALASWCREQREKTLPGRIVAQAKRHLLDAIGAGAAGAGHPVVRALAQALDDSGKALVFTDAEGRGVRSAARINGAAIHALEVDDTEGCDHSAAVVLPAALGALDAAGQPVSGTDFLRAVVLGYETGRRVQTALGGYESHNRAGWHSTATCGGFAAAIAAGMVLELSAVELASALGIAGSAAAGTWAFAADGADTKRLHPGNAAASGLDAALLARTGVRGPEKIFDDVWGGLLRTYAGPDAAPDALLDGLGDVWAFEHSALKPYASCRSTHSAVDAVRSLLADGRAAEQIRRVEILGSQLLADMVFPAPVASADVARMSLPYSIALVLTGRSLMPGSFEHTSDPALCAWMDKIQFTLESEQTHPEPLVRLVLTDGTAIETRAADPRGSMEDPLDDEAVSAKFDELTAPHLPSARADAIKRGCLGIDGLAKVASRELLGLPS